jgi:hypothetical protein
MPEEVEKAKIADVTKREILIAQYILDVNALQEIVT